MQVKAHPAPHACPAPQGLTIGSLGARQSCVVCGLNLDFDEALFRVLQRVRDEAQNDLDEVCEVGKESRILGTHEHQLDPPWVRQMLQLFKCLAAHAEGIQLNKLHGHAAGFNLG
ncbi:MAG: hypothetical protein ACI841_001628 [Planctomycetota bacterium]|jgi:hypothetical protein